MVKNFIDEIPFTFDPRIIATSKAETDDYTDYALMVYMGRRSKPLPLGRMTIYSDKIELLKTSYIDNEAQRAAWNNLMHVMARVGDLSSLPIDSVEVYFGDY